MRGILGVVLSACLLVGCGGVEADDVGGPANDGSADVTSFAYPACSSVAMETCSVNMARRYCTSPTGQTAVCFCDGAWWECPIFE